MGAEFTRRFGLKIHTFYGSSECGGIAYDAADEALYEEGFVGTPMRHVRVARRRMSRIEVRSGAVGEGYFPEPEPEVLAEGRFVPGDLVRMGARGLYLAGRAGDVINIAGRKLNPGEVEAQLARCPGVQAGGRLRRALAAAARGGGGLRERPGWSRRRCCGLPARCLSGWQVPRDVWIVPELPVNERGKISRRELALRYLEETRQGGRRRAAARIILSHELASTT